ncbi:LiaF transmembrane domain-containing protein [Arcticibacter eurypsychrophilus]|uniref:LiaF transmembrane domain-containing protein n=1 Tax=Arcticibacter eurypsychrophilus TaxID=1434752 RepID=UPI00084DD8B3|nr:DUF5668 domain-containing protein [Arcticibacter eurypsychrophilus]
MENSNPIYNKRQGSGKKWAGLIFLFIGVVLLVRSLGVLIPDWLTSWPMILIAVGIFTGNRQNYRNPTSVILIVIGVVFLVARIIPGVDLGNFVFPVLVMAIGLYLILGKKKFSKQFLNKDIKVVKDPIVWDKRVPTEEDGEPIILEKETGESSSDQKEQHTGGAEDYLDTVSIFGGIKKNIVSKNFLGGEIVTIMGGAEINLTQADINGTIVIDITQVFGGTKLIVPPQWKVSSDLAAIFGGIEDKRPLVQSINLADNKVLILRGTSIFGGIDIRSY